MDQRTRTEKIFERVQAAKLVKLSELSSEFGVSMPTIRKDIDELQRLGRVERVHGNVRLKSAQHETARRSYETPILPTRPEKALIGKKAASLIANGDAVILDCGATATELAKNLLDRQNLRSVTNALNIAILLGAEPTNRVMLTGGIFKPETIAVSGEKASKFFEGMFVDKLFLAAGGVSMESGISYPDFIDLHVKARDDRRGQDHLSARRFQEVRQARVRGFRRDGSHRHLVTDDGLGDEFVGWLTANGIEILYA